MSPVIGTRFLLWKTVVISVGLMAMSVGSVVVVGIRDVQQIMLAELPRAMMVHPMFREVSRRVVVWTEVLLARVATLVLV